MLAWDKARSEGQVLDVGQSLGSSWQSAFVIPAYLQEQYPDLDSVEDLKDPQFRRLFQTAESGDKARLVSCVINWDCERTNAAQIAGYGLEDHVHIVNPGSEAALNADLHSPPMNGESPGSATSGAPTTRLSSLNWSAWKNLPTATSAGRLAKPAPTRTPPSSSL